MCHMVCFVLLSGPSQGRELVTGLVLWLVSRRVAMGRWGRHVMSSRQVGSALPRKSYDVQQASGKCFANDVIRCPAGKLEALCQGHHTVSNRQVGSALPRKSYDIQQASGKRFVKEVI